MTRVFAALAVFAALLVGAWLAACLDRATCAARGRPMAGGAGPLAPLRIGASLILRRQAETERPDRFLLYLAPGLYLALAMIALATVPLLPAGALIESPVGIVIWGSCEALVIVAVFLQGWAPNSPFPQIAAFRFVAIGLPMMLPSMFVLIAAALPAQSLSLAAITAAQEPAWNLLRQPLGLPLFVLVGLAFTLRGPLDYAGGTDLAGGIEAEASGPALAVWRLARLCMLVAVSAMGAALFLGGPAPVGAVPGAAAMALKSLAVMVLILLAGHLLGLRIPPSRMLTFVWAGLLPLSFVHLLQSGLEALP